MPNYEAGQLFNLSTGNRLYVISTEPIGSGEYLETAVFCQYRLSDGRLSFAIFSAKALDAEQMTFDHLHTAPNPDAEEADWHYREWKNPEQEQGIYILTPTALENLILNDMRPNLPDGYNYHTFPTSTERDRENL